ncbi:MAG: penicillin-binding protein 2, partial [Candidatus Omnitrophica bacterium]|nr:penicillin-binding protein 2 [Candidatus Omnitrophota bacterium]
YGGDTVNYSIGQGYLLVTPIQVVCMMSAFANGGYLVRPYIIEKIDNIKISNPKIKKIDVSGDTLNLIRVGLKKVVNDPRGTGMKARLKDILLAGKTGTAQNSEGKAHGWFSGFAPFDNPKICVIVFVEFGGKGGLEASIIARKVIEKSRELGIT